ncbi:MAG: hypothetical protein N2167_01465 [Flavobacteriales bacterium]|nr:hypothetical protein [Flavobacteriales bacterium]
MKTKVFFSIVMFFFAASLMAQTEKTIKESEKVVVGGKVSTTSVKPVQIGTPQPEISTDKNKPTTKSIDKRMHAEIRSNGHAFSGKGNGKKHDIIEPKPELKHYKKNMQGIKKE